MSDDHQSWQSVSNDNINNNSIYINNNNINDNNTNSIDINLSNDNNINMIMEQTAQILINTQQKLMMLEFQITKYHKAFSSSEKRLETERKRVQYLKRTLYDVGVSNSHISDSYRWGAEIIKYKKSPNKKLTYTKLPKNEKTYDIGQLTGEEEFTLLNSGSDTLFVHHLCIKNKNDPNQIINFVIKPLHISQTDIFDDDSKNDDNNNNNNNNNNNSNHSNNNNNTNNNNDNNKHEDNLIITSSNNNSIKPHEHFSVSFKYPITQIPNTYKLCYRLFSKEKALTNKSGFFGVKLHFQYTVKSRGN